MDGSTEEVCPPPQQEALRGDRELGEPGKQLLAWCCLALINQGLIVARLPSARPSTMALHHLYDAGQLLAMGALSFCVVRLARELGARLGRQPPRWARIGLVAAAAFAVSRAIVSDDLSNLADRLGASGALVATMASLLFAAALVTTAFLPLPRLTRPLMLALAAAIAVGNGLALESDYLASHFLAAWLAAQLIVRSLDKVRVPVRADSHVAVSFTAVVGLASVATIVVPPPPGVLQRLYALPSSAPAPIVARLLPDPGTFDRNAVPPEYLRSPWFNDRKHVVPTPPTRAWKPPDEPIVILLTVDAFRADVLTSKEHDKIIPVLSGMRRRAVHFNSARSPCPGTVTAFSSLFSGKYYSGLLFEMQPRGKILPVDDPSPRFPQLLSAAGVRTSHVMLFKGIRGANGVSSGFTVERFVGAGKARNAVNHIIEELKAPFDGPRFIFSHVLEPHSPYTSGGKQGSAFERYVREIGVVDKQIGRLKKFLERAGLKERTILIVSADHGEAFGEHGMEFHAKALYEEFLRVPLLVELPGVEAREVSTPVTILDIGPTILDIFGLPAPPTFMGESLVPLMVGDSREPTRPIAAESGRRMQALYLKDGRKVILDLGRHSVEVYDLNRDPGERHNLADGAGTDVKAAVETTRMFFDRQRLQHPGWEPPYRPH